jgi:transcriptional regulator with XRE-family HTH domain
MTGLIRQARIDRGWSQARLTAELQAVARHQGIELPHAETMKSRISRWENGHARPDGFYRRLLREALGMDDQELGLTESGETPLVSAAADLRMHLEFGKQVDGGLLAALQNQTESIRVQDRQFGAGQLLELLRGHVRNLEAHLSHAVFEEARRPVAAVLADAAALAGWQALDVGSVDQAWRFLATASAAARQADDAGLYAFARLQQASVLAELDRAAEAADLASAVWESAERRVAPFVRCWLAAATAEMYAGDDRSGGARAQLRVAESMAGALAASGPPCLVFDELHLERWVGHTLVRLHDPAAEPRLTAVAARMDKTFTRASASLTIDLAAALLQRQERSEGLIRLAAGEELARKVGSRRQLRRASRLRLAC